MSYHILICMDICLFLQKTGSHRDVRSAYCSLSFSIRNQHALRTIHGETEDFLAPMAALLSYPSTLAIYAIVIPLPCLVIREKTVYCPYGYFLNASKHCFRRFLCLEAGFEFFITKSTAIFISFDVTLAPDLST